MSATQTTNTATGAQMLRRGVALLLAFVVLACVASRGLPVQGWWNEHGSVIRHESFPADCSLCHEGDDWNSIRADIDFDHEKETGYALIGAHENAQCLRCHNDRGPIEVFVKRGCIGCHENRHRGKHGERCENCHDKFSWRAKAAIRDHQRTRFPLTGVHAGTPCWRCHQGAASGEFKPMDTDCTYCHLDDAARTTLPDHTLLGLTNDCDRCHRPISWRGAGFNHDWFPLIGGHNTNECERCHNPGILPAPLPVCLGCHIMDYVGTTNPPHAIWGFPTTCDSCHTPLFFLGTQMNHSAVSNPCMTCHTADYTGTTSPDHAGTGIGTNYQDCHMTSGWIPTLP